MINFEEVENNAKQKNAIVDGDYIENDLYHCGFCNTPKQTIVNLFSQDRKVSCMCKCRSEKYKQTQERINEQIKQNKITALKSSGLQDRSVKNYTFERDNGYNRKEMNLAKRYVEHFDEMKKLNKGIIFYGDVGTGKTFATGCISNALLDKGVSVLFTSLSKIAKELQGFMIEDKNSYIESFSKYSLLILDDLGTERSSEYAMEIVFDIIDGRSKSKKPLIVNTNLTLDELQNHKDLKYKRIYSRILENCTPILFSGSNIRDINAKTNTDEFIKILKSS